MNCISSYILCRIKKSKKKLKIEEIERFETFNITCMVLNLGPVYVTAMQDEFYLKKIYIKGQIGTQHLDPPALRSPSFQ